MKWVIKSKAEEKYIATGKITVEHSIFARKFNSRKQANAFLRGSGYNKKEYALYEFDEPLVPADTEEYIKEIERSIGEYYKELCRNRKVHILYE